MFNKIKTIQLEPVEFLWKMVISWLFCVPVSILGLGMLGWYIGSQFGFDRLPMSLLVAFCALVGTGVGLLLSIVVVSMGHKEKFLS